MQVPLTLKDHIPAPNCPYLPLRFDIPDIRYPLWNHRLIESFGKDYSKGRLVHRAYYRPFSFLVQDVPTPPLLIAGDHLFEWIHSHHTFPACVVLFTVNPLTHSPTPEVSVDRRAIYGCPIYTVTFWDIPPYIPPILRSSLQTIEDTLEADLESFVTWLEVFIEEHFKPYLPFVEEGYTNLLPHLPCLTPSFDHNPITIPLGYSQK